MIKTETRLSRQAARVGLHEPVTEDVIAQGAPRMGQDTLLVIDPCATAAPSRSANGGWPCQVVGVECGGQEITPSTPSGAGRTRRL